MIGYKRSALYYYLPLLYLAFLFSSLSVALWPVDFFSAQEGHQLLFGHPVRCGAPFVTRYIHSVERTPVEDEYRIIGSKLWSWEERIRSHNAGLPFTAPEYGRFLTDGEWMRVQGGRLSWKELVYRVGDVWVGRNECRFPLHPFIPLYILYPGKRIRFTVQLLPLWEASLKIKPD